MNAAATVDVPLVRMPFMAAVDARFAVQVAESESGGVGAGIWFFGHIDPKRFVFALVDGV
ncbi:hypothetical protein ACFVW1_15985 [Streptomyces olivochromogenes]|uniref:hypothetical protein n=1 Tax=Streptomyces olivochromogenes TaxID=1963 RepID=UPI0036DEB203